MEAEKSESPPLSLRFCSALNLFFKIKFEAKLLQDFKKNYCSNSGMTFASIRVCVCF